VTINKKIRKAMKHDSHESFLAEPLGRTKETGGRKGQKMPTAPGRNSGKVRVEAAKEARGVRKGLAQPGCKMIEP